MSANTTDHSTLEELLRRHFGYSSFQRGQKEPIEAVLRGGDAIVVMPTGAGKSVCFQLPALMLQGITLVVSPLISLMKDQVDGLTARGLPATALNSTLSTEEVSARVADLRGGRTKLVYVAPERFRNKGFQNLLADLNVSLIAIDEAHCISQWGHDFRPDYTRLGDVVKLFSTARVVALTATATPDVRADISRQLGLGNHGRSAPHVFVSGFRRDNLRLKVSHVSTHAEKMNRILRVLDQYPTGIIYCSTRKQVERVGAMLGDEGVRHMIYHAGLTDEQRHHAQDRFMGGEFPIVVATNAFGMGVDRSDLRFVIHWDVPGSIEAYYQEVGRAGRDGQLSHCELLYNYADVRTQEFFLDGSNPDPSVILDMWNEVRQLLQQGPLTCPLEEWGERLQSTDNKITVHTCMGLFERCGLIERDIKAGSRCYTTSLVVGGNVTRLHDMLPSLKEKRNRDMKKLDLMLRYTNTRQCRHQFILDYFGDSAMPGDSCGSCDHCGFGTVERPRPPSPGEWPVLQKLLSCVGRMDGRFGKNTIIAVASGSKAKEITDRDLQKLSTYGILSGTPSAFLRDLFDELVKAGAIALTLDQYSVANLTPLGREVAWQRASVDLKWPAIAKGDRDQATRSALKPGSARLRTRPGTGMSPSSPNLDRILSAEEDLLFEALKEWRREEAIHQGIPPYLIFGNKTLKALAILRPTTHAALEKIVGIGPAKLEAYGADLLRLLKNSRD